MTDTPRRWWVCPVCGAQLGYIMAYLNCDRLMVHDGTWREGRGSVRCWSCGEVREWHYRRRETTNNLELLS